MAVSFERAVEQDLNLGYGTVTVTNPAGGSLIGNKIGLHTILGSRCVNAANFNTLADAAAAIGSDGLIIIPPEYAGTDAITLGNNIAVLDFRNGVSMGISSQIEAVRPVTGFPLGSDLRLIANGAADLYLSWDTGTGGARTTTTASLSIGANSNVAVGNTTKFAASAPLYVGRGTANEEIVVTWAIVDSTHIDLTCTKTHAGTTDIEQMGSMIFDARGLYLRSILPSQQSFEYFKIYNTNGDEILFVPSDTAATWPKGGVRFPNFLTGTYANQDFAIRHYNTSSKFRLRHSADTHDVFYVDNNSILQLAVPTRQYLQGPGVTGVPATGYGVRDATGGLTLWGYDPAVGTFQTYMDNQIIKSLPSIFMNDSQASGKQFAIRNGVVAGRLSLSDETAGVEFFAYDATDRIQLKHTTKITVGGLVVGAATSGDKGVGTINIASDIYKNNTAYTNPDYAFEHYFRGAIDIFKNNPGVEGYEGLLPLDKLRAYVKEHLRLPRISGATGIFDRADRVLERLEEAYLYIFELSDRITALENKLNGTVSS